MKDKERDSSTVPFLSWWEAILNCPQLSSTHNCPQLSLSQLLKRKPEKALSCVGLSLIECASMKMIYHRPTYSIGHQARTSHTPQLPFSTQINPVRCAAAPLLRSLRDSCPITPILDSLSLFFQGFIVPVPIWLGIYCLSPYHYEDT